MLDFARFDIDQAGAANAFLADALDVETVIAQYVERAAIGRYFELELRAREPQPKRPVFAEAVLVGLEAFEMHRAARPVPCGWT